MPDFVRYHIGFRELTGFAAHLAAAETRCDLIEECGVEIDLAVHRAIERAHGRLRDAAAVGVGRTTVQDQDRRGIGPAPAGKHLFPFDFGTAKNLADESPHVVLRRRRTASAWR